MMKKQFRIWTEWTDRCQDTGLTVEATDADSAIALAHDVGMAWGLGADRRFVGVVAQRDPSTRNHEGDL